MSKLEEKEAIVQRKSNKLGKIKDFLDDKCVDQCEDGKTPFITIKVM